MQVLSYIVVMNLAAFAAFGLDKSFAKSGAWRIPEKVLFFLAIAGGSLGAFLGMRFFHHKTKHPQFKYGIPCIMAIEVALCLWIGVKIITRT